MEKHRSGIAKAGKIAIGALSAFIMLFIISIILMVTLLNPNNFKTQISNLIQKETGRTLTMNGDVKWNFFPSLGLKLNDVTMSNAPGFGPQPFAQVGKAEVDVRLVPLFTGQVAIGKVKLTELTLNLSKNTQGNNNWDDMRNPKQQTSVTNSNKNSNQAAVAANQSPAKGKIPLLTISNIDVSNATINWNNQQAKQQIKIDQLNLTSNAVNFGKPFPIKISMRVNSSQPAVNATVNFSTQALLNPTQQQYALKSLNLNGNLIGNQYAAGKFPFSLNGDIAANLKDQTLTTNTLTIKLANLAATGTLSGNNIVKAPSFTSDITIPNFNLRNFLTAVGKKSQLADNTAMQAAALKTNAQFSANNFSFNNITAKLDDSVLTGNFNFTSGKNKNFNFALKVNQINLGRYLADADTNNSNASNSNTPANLANKPGNSGKTTAVAKAPVPAVPENLLPVKFLRDLNGQGTAQIGTLKIANITLTNLNTGFNANSGVIRVAPMSAGFYQGKSQGFVVLNVQSDTPNININENLTNVQVGDFMNDLSKNSKIRITGTGNLAMSLQTVGQTADEMKSNLNGAIKFAVNNGTVKNIDIGQQIFAAIQHIFKQGSNNNQSTDQTNFSSLTGTVGIKNGVAYNNDLLLKSPALEVTGKGTANIINQTINYTLNAKAVGGPFGKDIFNLQDQIGGSVPIKITGNFTNPSIGPDYTSITTEALKGQFQKQLEKHFGLNANNQNVQQNVGKAVDAIKGFLGN